MKIYVVEGITDDTIQLGCSTSKKEAEKRMKEINDNGGIGYCSTSVWVTEYEVTDRWTDFD